MIQRECGVVISFETVAPIVQVDLQVAEVGLELQISQPLTSDCWDYRIYATISSLYSAGHERPALVAAG